MEVAWQAAGEVAFTLGEGEPTEATPRIGEFAVVFAVSRAEQRAGFSVELGRTAQLTGLLEGIGEHEGRARPGPSAGLHES